MAAFLIAVPSLPPVDADESLPQRVDRLERGQDDLREQVADVQVLAAGADRDASTVRAERRAHNNVLHALRATRLEQGLQLQEHTRVLGTVQAGMTALIDLLTPPASETS